MTDNERFDIVAEVRVIKQRFEDWTEQHDKHTSEWRFGIEKKLDSILEMFNGVPCKTKCQNEDKITTLWVLVTGILLAVVVQYIQR